LTNTRAQRTNEKETLGSFQKKETLGKNTTSYHNSNSKWETKGKHTLAHKPSHHHSPEPEKDTTSPKKLKVTEPRWWQSINQITITMAAKHPLEAIDHHEIATKHLSEQRRPIIRK
jgi:hypothetical protein